MLRLLNASTLRALANAPLANANASTHIFHTLRVWLVCVFR